jgi:hypothetical protein
MKYLQIIFILKGTNFPDVQIYGHTNPCWVMEEGWSLFFSKQDGKGAVVNFSEADMKRERMWV